jgi:hypothetical protein
MNVTSLTLTKTMMRLAQQDTQSKVGVASKHKNATDRKQQQHKSQKQRIIRRYAATLKA